MQKKRLQQLLYGRNSKLELVLNFKIFFLPRKKYDPPVPHIRTTTSKTTGMTCTTDRETVHPSTSARSLESQTTKTQTTWTSANVRERSSQASPSGRVSSSRETLSPTRTQRETPCARALSNACSARRKYPPRDATFSRSTSTNPPTSSCSATDTSSTFPSSTRRQEAF